MTCRLPDFDLASVDWRLRLGHDDAQDTLDQVGRDALAIDGKPEPKRPRELPLAALELLVALGTAGLATALAADGQRPVVKFDLDVVPAEAGDLDRQEVTVAVFAQVNRRHPPRRRAAEQALEPLLHGEQVADRIPGHGSNHSAQNAR